MMNMYNNLYKCFASRMRPVHFTDYTHCEECAEHDATLRASDNDSISFQDVGNIAYSPISFISIEGFLYYLPGLARLAGGIEDEYFLDTFLVYLECQERRNSLNEHERKTLSDYLVYLKETIIESIQENLDSEDLDELIGWLKNQ